jgi:hypothetical protein
MLGDSVLVIDSTVDHNHKFINIYLTMILHVHPETFQELGNGLIWRSNAVRQRKRALRKFRSFFGTSPENCTTIWGMIASRDDLTALIPKNAKPKHILWALMFLKLYDATEVLSSIADVSEKTYTKWQWIFVKAIFSCMDDLVSDNWLAFNLLVVVSSWLLRSTWKTDSRRISATLPK